MGLSADPGAAVRRRSPRARVADPAAAGSERARSGQRIEMLNGISASVRPTGKAEASIQAPSTGDRPGADARPAAEEGSSCWSWIQLCSSRSRNFRSDFGKRSTVKVWSGKEMNGPWFGFYVGIRKAGQFRKVTKVCKSIYSRARHKEEFNEWYASGTRSVSVPLYGLIAVDLRRALRSETRPSCSEYCSCSWRLSGWFWLERGLRHP